MRPAWKIPSTMADQPLEPPGRSGRVALLVGFGGMILLLAAFGAHSFNVLIEMERQRSASDRRFLDKNRLLEQLRTDIYSEGVELRHYLLATDAGEARSSAPAVAALHREIGQGFSAYAKLAGPDEESLLSGARQAWDQYSLAVRPALLWDEPARRARGRDFLAHAPVGQRLRALAVSERINALNNRHLQGQSDRSAALFADFRRKVLLLLALAALAGVALAGWTVRHLLRLESASRARYRQLLHAQAELHELSAELVNAQEQERRSISRELHDEVGQSLGALLVDLGRAIQMLPPGQSRDLVGSARRVAGQLVEEVRNIALLLRPSMLDDFGLAPAIHWQAREVSRRTGLRVEVTADELPDSLSEEHRTCIFRIVQETLNNAARHSRASLVNIDVRLDPGRVMLVVQDNGVGFDPRTTRGVGIVGMEERVRHLGGVLRIQSEPGKGTLWKVELPVTDLDSRCEPAPFPAAGTGHV